MTASPDTTTARPAAAEPPPLDERTLGQLAQLDPTGANRLMARVLTAYRDSLARLSGQLAQARAADDLPATRLAVHTLKSSSASIGALQLAALCAQAELAVREGQAHTLPPVLDRLASEAVRVDAAVQHLLVQHS
ncbi:Hpt domain-containing protein [Ideonella sp. DXS22W]|uniref:Hpt domain-containing protein n=1 Tax=Pseudaquabacterium inlustre TaxID=2984192 RepID=A0ABU9C9V5_9BURK